MLLLDHVDRNLGYVGMNDRFVEKGMQSHQIGI